MVAVPVMKFTYPIMSNTVDVMKVCRLCLGTESLVWVFDDMEKPENMKDVIQISTGVIITPTDTVSQMICRNCVNITTRMIKFRSASVINDNKLKVLAYQRSMPSMSRSVELLVKQYPKILLPNSVKKCNIAPKVALDKNQVTAYLENYRRKRRIQKKMMKQWKSSTEKNNETSINQFDIDIENKLTPHIIENNDVSSYTPQVLPPKISPLKLKLSIETNQNLKQISNENNIDQNNHVEDIRKSADMNLQLSTEVDKENSKRKLTLSFPKSKKTKTDNTDTVDSTDSLMTLKYTTRSLFVCDICSSILYSAKDLHRHKVKHMKCKLCKKRFSTLEETKEHSQNDCEIMHIMNNLPKVVLKRCDKVQEILDQFPSAFGLAAPKNVLIIPTRSNLVEDTIKNPMKDTFALDQNDAKPTLETCETLLISDDDDDDEANNNQEKLPRNENGKNNSNVNQSNKTNAITVIKSTGKSTISEKKQTSSTIKRNIEIVDEDVLDVNLDDNDITLLKNILKRRRKNFTEQYVQTDMPLNSDIITSMNQNKLFELRNLRKYLNFYKIPVNVSYAPQYSVKFGFDPSPLVKKDRSWSKIQTISSKSHSNKNMSTSSPKPVDMPILVESVINTKTPAAPPNIPSKMVAISTPQRINQINNNTANQGNSNISKVLVQNSSFQDTFVAGFLNEKQIPVSVPIFVIPKINNTNAKPSTTGIIQNGNTMSVAISTNVHRSDTVSQVNSPVLKPPIPVPSTNYNPTSRIMYTPPKTMTASPLILNSSGKSLPQTDIRQPNIYYISNNNINNMTRMACSAPMQINQQIIPINNMTAMASSAIQTLSFPIQNNQPHVPINNISGTVTVGSSLSKNQQRTPVNNMTAISSSTGITRSFPPQNNQQRTPVNNMAAISSSTGITLSSPPQNNQQHTAVNNMAAKHSSSVVALDTRVEGNQLQSTPINIAASNSSRPIITNMPPPLYIPQRTGQKPIAPPFVSNSNIRPHHTQTQILNEVDALESSGAISNSTRMPYIRVKTVSELS